MSSAAIYFCREQTARPSRDLVVHSVRLARIVLFNGTAIRRHAGPAARTVRNVRLGKNHSNVISI
jgi:hypothetical protein